MEVRILTCGTLKVKALEMIKPRSLKDIRSSYDVDEDGSMKLAMNALLLEEGESKVLIDPGTADFLPARLRTEYGFEQPRSLEEVLREFNVSPEDISDVLFTHLHFDHGSGAFKRVPGNIVKRFPNARYHVLKEHYHYALKPDRVEASSFSTSLIKRLDKVHWLEDWDMDWISFKVFNGHTRGMVVPVIQTGEGSVYFMSDLCPMEIYLEEGTWCGYDLDPELLLKEKRDLLEEMDEGTQLIFFHDTLRNKVIYS
jgi:glyoxylase-like metal-dependent hydrolase (beta-lactamase superfamily II)